MRAALQRVLSVWQRNFLVFKKSWLVSFFWVLFEPISIFLGLGFGLGYFISSMDGKSYLDFFFAGVLSTSIMMVSFFVSTYENYSKLTYENLYASQLLTPLEPLDLLLGEITWATTKAALSALGVCLVGFFLGVLRLEKLPLIFVFVVLAAFIFSTFGMWITSKVRNYEQIIYPTSGILIPMSLFCGTYFPLEVFPKPLQALIWCLPLTHVVAGFRSIMSSQGPSWWTLLHFAVLVFFAVLLFSLARKKFELRLQK